MNESRESSTNLRSSSAVLLSMAVDRESDRFLALNSQRKRDCGIPRRAAYSRVRSSSAFLPHSCRDADKFILHSRSRRACRREPLSIAVDQPRVASPRPFFASFLRALSLVFFPLFLSLIPFRPVAMEPLYYFYCFCSRRNDAPCVLIGLSIIGHIIVPVSSSSSWLVLVRSNFSLIDYRSNYVDRLDRVSILPPLGINLLSEITSRVRTPLAAIGMIDSRESRLLLNAIGPYSSHRAIPFCPLSTLASYLECVK